MISVHYGNRITLDKFIFYLLEVNYLFDEEFPVQFIFVPSTCLKGTCQGAESGAIQTADGSDQQRLT